MLTKALQGAALATQPVFIEDTFSSFLYTGNGSTQTITNGIDLSGKGGLVWTKSRSNATSSELRDTIRGATKSLRPDSTAAEVTDTGNALTAFNNDGFSLGADTFFTTTNVSGRTYASWTFRKQAKFFDVVTYTGDGANRTIAHNLGSVPGCIIIKAYSGANAGNYDWAVYHRSLSATDFIVLNSTGGTNPGSTYWNNTAPTSTAFSLGSQVRVNETGQDYVAYLFAHDAGGFGSAGTDNVITCGSYTGNGSSTGPIITLNYEPQFVLIKNADAAANWVIADNMRGMPVGSADAKLCPNLSAAEVTTDNFISPTATGFQLTTSTVDYNQNGNKYIYIAIRRGPMRTPTSGTSVFQLHNFDNQTVNTLINSSVVPDMALHVNNLGGRYVISRLTGGINTATSSATSPRNWLETYNTLAEDTTTTGVYYEMFNKSFRLAGNGADPGTTMTIGYHLARAPGFFDVVCYTGTGANANITHNLGVAPELMIVKWRSGATGEDWYVYSANRGNGKYISLNTTAAEVSSGAYWNSTSPTASVFSLGSSAAVNGSGATYVAYLFATVTGVSKVGSYTGTGTTLSIDCGFTNSARFVLIKRTDSTGDWYVWDSARGIVAGNDPYLLLNSTAAEVTNTDYVDTSSAGFEISSTAPAAINANGGTFIFLAIA